MPNSYSSLCHTGPWRKDVFIVYRISDLLYLVLVLFLASQIDIFGEAASQAKNYIKIRANYNHRLKVQ
jgi:hypothetical protein